MKFKTARPAPFFSQISKPILSLRELNQFNQLLLYALLQQPIPQKPLRQVELTILLFPQRNKPTK